MRDLKRCLFAIVVLSIVMCAATALAVEQFPKPGWKDRADPLASPYARAGGQIVVFGGQYPKSLNYYLDNNTLSAEIFGVLYDSLLSVNPVTLAYEPDIADKWSISDDKKTFTFHIDPKARWSDGTPITAADVVWTYHALMNPKNMTGAQKLSMERFYPPKAVNRLTVRFVAKTVHWQNLLTLAGLSVLPKHAFAKKDFNKINFAFPVVSGPYRLGPVDEGVDVKIDKRSDWWQRKTLRNKGKYNFNTIVFKFFAERENAFEAFKKGNIDLYPVYTSRIWVKETTGPDFFTNRIIKQKVYNHHPVGFQGFAMNMRRFPFKDVRVRKAMALLLDREKMNRTLMYSQYFLERSYYPDLYSRTTPCPNPLIKMNKAAAQKLLAAAGWKVNPATGILEKDGKPFSFHFLTRDASADRFLAIYAQDLKDVGINLVIDKKDWAAWARDMDGFNYQMTWAAWGAGIFKDPEGMWSSKEANRKGGINITGFADPAVDALIQKQKTIFDVAKRNAICRKIDQIVYKQYPYVLLWNINYVRLLYWNKFGTPQTVLSKYGNESSALWYWWVDPDAAAALGDAIAHNLPLPPKPQAIYFDEIFGEKTAGEE